MSYGLVTSFLFASELVAAIKERKREKFNLATPTILMVSQVEFAMKIAVCFRAAIWRIVKNDNARQ